MKIISMAWTTPSFVADEKCETRRSWTPQYAEKFRKGDICKAYSRSPQWKGEPIGKLQLTDKPYRERTGVHNTDDGALAFYKAEGFEYMDDQYARLMLVEPPLYRLAKHWIKQNTEHWVVPFEIIEVEHGAFEKFNTPAEIIRCVDKLCEVFG